MPDEAQTYYFDDFSLDVVNRQLQQGSTRIELNGRYLDALILLVREHGHLVEKDQFFDEVWGDTVVSDSALTQCIKAIRKQLGDAAAHPRYIETVPRYGYRFIGTVSSTTSTDTTLTPEAKPTQPKQAENPNAEQSLEPPTLTAKPSRYSTVLVQGSVGMLGGSVAGILGGLVYGLGLAYTPTDPQIGTASLLLVLVSLNVVVGTLGGCGVSFGMAAVGLTRLSHPAWTIASAAFGGMLVGGLAKLLGMDAFTLLFGHAPAGITGGLEGAALGIALALGTYLGGGLRARQSWHPVIGAGLAGAVTGVLIPLAGGRLMGGSLELLARSFADSRLQLDTLGRFFGEVHFGATSQVFLGGIEGLFFGTCVVGAMILAQRHGAG